MIGIFPWLPRSLTFSTPGGIEGSDGKGITSVWMERLAERSGVKIGRFLGVIKIVMAKPRRASW